MLRALVISLLTFVFCLPAAAHDDPYPPYVLVGSGKLVAIADPQLLPILRDSIREWRIPPGRLKLELTESVLMNDGDQSAQLFGAIRDLGIQLFIDDFGTGYSSLSYLRRLPVDILKIAQPFVSDVTVDDTFVRTMVDLGKNLGLTIVAEGIEEPGQLEKLLDLGCDLGQGYLFAEPMPYDQLVGTLEAPTVS